jgi:hypothetical protein
VISIRHSRRVAPVREPRRGAHEALPWAERVLQGMGAHSGFADALLGDLTEERARRAERQGAIAARWWYAREAFRSVPHLLRNALRHGGARGRARAAAVLSVMALVPTVALIAVLLREGPPARLVFESQGGRRAFDGIVLNTRHPVQLETRALDATGRPLRSAKIRYQWAAGAPVRVTPAGVVTCTQPGDATVRASAGAVATTVILRCRPVKTVHAEMDVNLVAGGPGHDLVFMAIGPDGRPVDLLTGELQVEDSTIATLHGTHLRPVRPGMTNVTMHIGDGEGWTEVSVYEQVRTFEGLRSDQQLVVAPVLLTRASTVRWSLPTGLFELSYGRSSNRQPIPTFAVDGPVMCMPDFGPTVEHVRCLVRGPGASLRITHPGTVTGEISGSIALWQQRYR